MTPLRGVTRRQTVAEGMMLFMGTLSIERGSQACIISRTPDVIRNNPSRGGLDFVNMVGTPPSERMAQTREKLTGAFQYMNDDAASCVS